MSLLEELIKDRFDTSHEITKDRYISMCIIQKYLREHEGNRSIYETFEYLKALTSVVCSDNRWEPFANGYQTRTNFRYDTELGEITFDTHRIIKQDGKYISDGSEVSDKQLSEHPGDFAALAKVDDIIYRYYLLDKDNIDKNLNGVETYKNTSARIMEERISYEQRHNELFFKLFGTIGRELLLKWLNKLGQPDGDIRDLWSEFKNDAATAKLYLEAQGGAGYNDARRSHLDFEDVLLRVIERYSPRGNLLRMGNYKAYMEEQHKRTV